MRSLYQAQDFSLSLKKPWLIQELATDYQAGQLTIQPMLLIKIVAQRYCAI